jgi:hypothetical protein
MAPQSLLSWIDCSIITYTTLHPPRSPVHSDWLQPLPVPSQTIPLPCSSSTSSNVQAIIYKLCHSLPPRKHDTSSDNVPNSNSDKFGRRAKARKVSWTKSLPVFFLFPSKTKSKRRHRENRQTRCAEKAVRWRRGHSSTENFKRAIPRNQSCLLNEPNGIVFLPSAF